MQVHVKTLPEPRASRLRHRPPIKVMVQGSHRGAAAKKTTAAAVPQPKPAGVGGSGDRKPVGSLRRLMGKTKRSHQTKLPKDSRELQLALMERRKTRDINLRIEKSVAAKVLRAGEKISTALNEIRTAGKEEVKQMRKQERTRDKSALERRIAEVDGRRKLEEAGITSKPQQDRMLSAAGVRGGAKGALIARAAVLSAERSSAAAGANAAVAAAATAGTGSAATEGARKSRLEQLMDRQAQQYEARKVLTIAPTPAAAARAGRVKAEQALLEL